MPSDRGAAMLLGVAGLTLLAALIRFGTLHVQSFDADEAATVGLLHRSLGGMLHEIPISEQTPPLYYLLAWGWARLFGYGEAGVRSLSALAGTVTVPLAYAAARELASRRAGIVTAALVACNPFLFWYSQEARSYALLALLTTAALWMFARALRNPGGRAVWLWGVLSALSLATHYFAVFLVVPEAAWLLWAARGRRREGPLSVARMRTTIGGVAIPAVAGLALVPLVIAQRSPQKYPFTRLQSLTTRITSGPRHLLMGFALPSGAAWTAAGVALFAVAAWLLVRYADPIERRGARRAATLAAIALIAPVVIALGGVDEVLDRNFIAVLVPCLAIAGAGFASRRAGWAAATAMCVVWLAAITVVQSSARWQRPPWRQVASALGPANGARLILTMPATLEDWPLPLYLPGTRLSFRPPKHLDEVDVVSMGTARSGERLGLERLTAPPGFRQSLLLETPSYVLLRYRAEQSRNGSLVALMRWRANRASLLHPPVCCDSALQPASASMRLVTR